MLVDTYLKIICGDFIIAETGITGSLLFLSSLGQLPLPQTDIQTMKGMNFLTISSLIEPEELNLHRSYHPTYHHMIGW